MNKRGMTLEVILPLIIAVGLVILLIFGPLKGVIADKALPFFKNLPGFNQAEQNPIMFGNVRYNVLENNVERYDGERWNAFGKDAQFAALNDPISEIILEQNFNSYYFNKENRNDQERLYEFEDKVVLPVRVLENEEKPTIGGTAVRGSIVLGIWKTTTQGRLESVKDTFIFVDPSGNVDKIITTGKDVTLTREQQASIAPKAIVWKNSVVKKPIIIEGKQFCVTIIDNIYLNVDLNNPGACNA